MCGICGYTGNRDINILNQMLESITHRGPNDIGYFSDSKINIGIVRLSIIDISGGHQPISNENGTIQVVFNGEIYNYIELKEDLIDKGHIFKTASDTETIVHAYEEFGLSFPHKLNGMFSIAIWDIPQQTLILIRDRYGVKPLFYMVKSNYIVFASEIKAILCYPTVNKEIDYEALAHYFSLRNIPAPFTIYEDIKALLPGNLLIFNDKECKIQRWYNLKMESKWTEDDEYILIDHIDQILRDSVRLRLRSDVNYGAYLSGGVDSSTIVAIMSEYSPKPVKTFTLAFADSPSHKVDSYYAQIVSKRYRTEHHEYLMDWSELQNEVVTITCHLDQPFAGVISSFWLSRFMRNFVTVALSGDGADDTFASYGHHRLVWPIVEVQKALKNRSNLDNVDYSFFKDRKEFIINLAKYNPWEWRLAYASFMEEEKKFLFTNKGRNTFLPFSTSEFLSKIYKESDPKIDELNKMLYLDINTLLPNEILYFNDMLSMANSIEVRTPFLDYRLVELACSIPGTLKIKNMILKYILQKVAARYVPEEILKRPKEGFVLPKNTWLRQGMAPMLKEVLSKKRLSIHGYFNQQYINSLISKFLAGDDSLTFRIWVLIIFQLWYENYLENN